MTNLYEMKRGKKVCPQHCTPFLLSCLFLITLLTITACGGGNKPPTESQSSAAAGPANGDIIPGPYANNMLADPLAEEILQTMFSPERDIASNGAVGDNQQGYRNIRGQGEGAYLALALGMARSDRELIARGVNALEFGMRYQNANGSFAHSSLQDMARFALFGLRAYHLLMNSSYAHNYSVRMDTLFAGLLQLNTLLLDQLPLHPEIYEDTNQVAMLAYILLASGQEIRDTGLTSKGQQLLQWVLSVQRENGVFPERGGHDSHYQAISVLALANLYTHTHSDDIRMKLHSVLKTGLEWLQSRISARGFINDRGNTRTANDPRLSPEGKQIDPREIAWTLLYLSHLDPAFSKARIVSESVLRHYLAERGPLDQGRETNNRLHYNPAIGSDDETVLIKSGTLAFIYCRVFYSHCGFPSFGNLGNRQRNLLEKTPGGSHHSSAGSFLQLFSRPAFSLLHGLDRLSFWAFYRLSNTRNILVS